MVDTPIIHEAEMKPAYNKSLGSFRVSGIEEMPKSEIKKRKGNMESISRISKCRDMFSGSRREQDFLQKKIKKSAIFSSFERRKRNFENKSHDSRGN